MFKFKLSNHNEDYAKNKKRKFHSVWLYGTHAGVFSQTLAYLNKMNEIRQ